MPLPEDFKLPKADQYPVVEDDTYQVKILDIEDVDGTDFNTGEAQPQLKFSFKIVTPGDDYGKLLFKWVSMKYSPAKGGRSESNLHAIVTKTLKKEITVDDLKMNDLIGRQLRLVVTKVEKDGMFRNKITGYMSSKQDIEDGGDVSEAKTDEVNLGDIPF